MRFKRMLNEVDLSNVNQQKKIGGMMNDISGSSESVRITIMKKMGASQKEISGWLSAKKRGVSFEAYLVSLIQKLKDNKLE